MADTPTTSELVSLEYAWQRLMKQLGTTNVQTVSDQKAVQRQIRRIWAGS
jgi:hypothetical protein